MKNFFFALEIVKKIGLGKAGTLGDLVQRCPPKAIKRKNLKSSFGDQLTIALLNARLTRPFFIGGHFLVPAIPIH